MTGTLEFLPGFVFTAALFGLRKLDPKRGKSIRAEDWAKLWEFWTEIGNPPLPCTASWCQDR